MHTKVLPDGSRRLLDVVDAADPALLEDWVLAGGTGLALQIGHRRSEDFDFFRTDAADVAELERRLAALGPFELLRKSERDLTALVLGVKLSFFVVPEPLLRVPGEYRRFRVADLTDIALMKLVAVSGRGSRKDFVDLWFILQGGAPLADYFALLPRKYGEGRVNTYHVLKSLTYFEDAEQEPQVATLVPFRWEECTRFFVREAHRVVLA
ncbi:MAG: nucleotidyl transferase AbiEii/AbiGii toxin family protein [Candidatus Eiseniibacteriota bacterium]